MQKNLNYFVFLIVLTLLIFLKILNPAFIKSVSYLSFDLYQKIFAEETLDKMRELGFEPYLEEVASKNYDGILFRVMIGPMQSISDTNNARETLIRADFLPLLRTRCIKI